MPLLFHQTCLNERLLTNYVYFKIYDPAAHHNTDTQKYCCSLVKRLINYNKEKINTLKIHPPIPTWNQDTYQETWKDLNKIV